MLIPLYDSSLCNLNLSFKRQRLQFFQPFCIMNWICYLSHLCSTYRQQLLLMYFQLLRHIFCISHTTHHCFPLRHKEYKHHDCLALPRIYNHSVYILALPTESERYFFHTIFHLVFALASFNLGAIRHTFQQSVPCFASPLTDRLAQLPVSALPQIRHESSARTSR